MNRWNVFLLGKPRAEKEGQSIHLRSKKTWGLLASLLLAQHNTERKDTLLNRFWSDTPARQNLRQTVRSLRDAFGEECLLSDRDTLTLNAECFWCDITEIENHRLSAEAAHTLEGRLHPLSEAARYMTGEFLASFSPLEDNDGWIGNQRNRLRLEHGTLWLSLAAAMETSENRRGAFEAVCQAVQWIPEKESVWDTVLRLGQVTGQMQVVQELTLAHDLRSMAERLQKLEADAQPLTHRETSLFEKALEQRWRQLSPAEQEQLHALTVFPAPFTAPQARHICGILRSELQKFTEHGFLLREADRFALFQGTRQWLKTSLPYRQHPLSARFARYFLQWLVDSARSRTAVQAEQEHLRQALLHLMPEKSVKALNFYSTLIKYGLLELVEMGQIWCQNLLADPTVSREVSRQAAYYAGWAYLELKNFERARALLEESLRLCHKEEEEAEFVHIYFYLAVACHHAGDSVAAANYALKSARHSPRPEYRGDAMRFLSEIYRKIGEYDRAYAAGCEALQLQREAGQSPLIIAESLYQLGATEQQRGRCPEALAYFEEALRIRLDYNEQNGEADCLCGIARIFLRERRFALAEMMVRRALTLYQIRHNAESEAATLALLGDIFHQEGRKEEARQRYLAGLTFWQGRKHPDWIQHFERRLQTLEAEEE